MNITFPSLYLVDVYSSPVRDILFLPWLSLTKMCGHLFIFVCFFWSYRRQPHCSYQDLPDFCLQVFKFVPIFQFKFFSFIFFFCKVQFYFLQKYVIYRYFGDDIILIISLIYLYFWQDFFCFSLFKFYINLREFNTTKFKYFEDKTRAQDWI